jgi:protein TonB
MHCRLLSFGLVSMLLLASCSTSTPSIAMQASEPAVQAPVQVATAPAPSVFAPKSPIPALTMEGYKREFALRIVNANPEVFHDPLPKMLKSVIVVDVTIDRSGRLTNVFVTRSNGYKNLERIALENVRRAAPYAAPVGLLRRSDGSVNFMETFLFRDDGRFQVRSLAGIQ